MKIPKKNNPFTTPSGYFKEFPNDIKTRLIEEKLQLTKKSGFTVPNDYFDTLSFRITTKLDTKESKVIQLRPYKFYYSAAVSIAATVLVLVGLQWNGAKEASWDSVVNTDIETYFDNTGLGLTSYEIAEIIPVDGLEISNFIVTELDEEDILEYLSENTDDFEELNLDEYDE